MLLRPLFEIDLKWSVCDDKMVKMRSELFKMIRNCQYDICPWNICPGTAFVIITNATSAEVLKTLAVIVSVWREQSNFKLVKRLMLINF